MTSSETPNAWLFVANDILHLSRLKIHDENWWCVDHRSKAGDEAFIYKPRTGIILHLKILELCKTPESFCDSFQMATAIIKVQNLFDPPITCKQLKSFLGRNESFIRRNFFGKSFLFNSPETPAAILAIPKKVKDPQDVS
jgi:hypothetical protein